MSDEALIAAAERDRPGFSRARLVAMDEAVTHLRPETPTPQQIEEKLDELDRLCASTVTRNNSAGSRFWPLLDLLQRSDNQKARRLAARLREKFNEVGLMTPAEYRHTQREENG